MCYCTPIATHLENLKHTFTLYAEVDSILPYVANSMRSSPDKSGAVLLE